MDDVTPPYTGQVGTEHCISAFDGGSGGAREPGVIEGSAAGIYIRNSAWKLTASSYPAACPKTKRPAA